MDSVQAKRKIVIGSDHAGYTLKEILKEYLQSFGTYEIVDVGTHSLESCDFPDFAEQLANEVLKDKDTRGIVVCGSGIGVSISCNKVPGIRCALVHDYLTAQLAVEHTNCNVIAIGQFMLGQLVAKNVVDSFLSAKFVTTEPKYQQRIDKITEIEKKYSK